MKSSAALSLLKTFSIVFGVGVKRVSINTFLLDIGVRGDDCVIVGRLPGPVTEEVLLSVVSSSSSN